MTGTNDPDFIKRDTNGKPRYKKALLTDDQFKLAQYCNAIGNIEGVNAEKLFADTYLNLQRNYRDTASNNVDESGMSQSNPLKPLIERLQSALPEIQEHGVALDVLSDTYGKLHYEHQERANKIEADSLKRDQEYDNASRKRDAALAALMELTASNMLVTNRHLTEAGNAATRMPTIVGCPSLETMLNRAPTPQSEIYQE